METKNHLLKTETEEKRIEEITTEIEGTEGLDNLIEEDLFQIQGQGVMIHMIHTGEEEVTAIDHVLLVHLPTEDVNMRGKSTKDHIITITILI